MEMFLYRRISVRRILPFMISYLPEEDNGIHLEEETLNMTSASGEQAHRTAHVLDNAV